MKTYKSTVNKVRLVRDKTTISKVKIQSAEHCAAFARRLYGDEMDIYEMFYTVMLNNNNVTSDYAVISQGGINGTLVDIRLVTKYAIDTLCRSVILVHNHPSGSMKPSQADISITTKIKTALAAMDIEVLDHIILAPNDDDIPECEGVTFYSFANNGRI